MPLSYEDALKNPASRKIVLVRALFRKHLFAWREAGSGYPGIWWVPETTDHFIGGMEDGVDMTVEASLAALEVADTSLVGALFYSANEGRLYMKPKDVSGTTIYDYFYIGIIQQLFSKDSVEHESLPWDARISSLPTLNLRTGEIFDGKLGQIGGGGVGLENSDVYFFRRDIELDGEMEILAAFETMGGV